MFPARKGLDTGNRKVGSRIDRLIEHVQASACLERKTQVAFEALAFAQSLSEFLAEELEAAPSGILRFVERNVGLASELTAVRARRRSNGDADTHTDAVLNPEHFEWLRNLGHDLVRKAPRCPACRPRCD